MKNLIVSALAMLLIVTPALSQTKKKITSADQLPRRTIAVEGKVMDIYHDDELLDEMAATLYANYTSDLETFDLQDKSTLIAYYNSLMILEFRNEEYDKVKARIASIKLLQDREEEKLTTGLTISAYMAALKEFEPGTEDFEAAVGASYLKSLEALPYEKIEKYVISSRNRYKTVNKEVTLSSIETQLQPYIDNGQGQVMEQIVGAIISTKFVIENNFSLADTYLQALDTYYEKNKAQKVAKVDIWEDREATLKNHGSTVNIAIWDAGVDTNVFPDQLWQNEGEKANGKDDDANQFVDDIHGIAFDIHNSRTSGGLQEEPKLTYSKEQLLRWNKGSMDLRSGLMTQEAEELQVKVANLKPEEAKAFQEDLGWFGLYVHGTHVAGIALKGNPKARMLYTRLSYETSLLPSAPTEEKHLATIKMFEDMVEYWKKAGVQVVNISLRFSPGAYEALLNMHGIGKDQEERKAIAFRWFNAEKNALEKAFKNAPEILFVCGAGNEANDADFANYYPASLVLPNLLTVGAVDSEGKKTSFTTEGKNITIFANGYEVESFVPGGSKIKFSGTSMASPNVANLAAKMLVANPDLKPEQVISLMKETATVSEETDDIKLIHPRRAIEAALKLKKGYSASSIDQLLVSTK